MPFITSTDNGGTCSIVLSSALRYRLCSGSFYILLSWATFNLFNYLFYCLAIDLKLYKRLFHLLVSLSICWSLHWSVMIKLESLKTRTSNPGHSLMIVREWPCIRRHRETNRAVVLCLKQGQTDLTFNDIQNKLTWSVSTLISLYKQCTSIFLTEI